MGARAHSCAHSCPGKRREFAASAGARDERFRGAWLETCKLRSSCSHGVSRSYPSRFCSPRSRWDRDGRSGRANRLATSQRIRRHRARRPRWSRTCTAQAGGADPSRARWRSIPKPRTPFCRARGRANRREAFLVVAHGVTRRRVAWLDCSVGGEPVVVLLRDPVKMITRAVAKNAEEPIEE